MLFIWEAHRYLSPSGLIKVIRVVSQILPLSKKWVDQLKLIIYGCIALQDQRMSLQINAS
jgi:hypothetical protein